MLKGQAAALSYILPRVRTAIFGLGLDLEIFT